MPSVAADVFGTPALYPRGPEPPSYFRAASYELSLDGGETWHTVTMETPLSVYLLRDGGPCVWSKEEIARRIGLGTADVRPIPA